MTAPELSLKEIRKSPKLQQAPKTFRVSDFLTEEEKQARAKRKKERRKARAKRKFTTTDLIVAEIIARFGYEVYQKWDNYEIDHEKMMRLLEAERARERAGWLPMEAVVAQLVKDCIKRYKKEKKPTGPKEAAKIIKNDAKIATGEA